MINTPTKDKKIQKFLVKERERLGKFFNIRINKPKIFLLSSREQINKIRNRKTEGWLSAWAAKGNIYILNPRVYSKESDHKKEQFWPTLKHELAHLYFKKLTGVNYPKWLNEGLAGYLAGQVNKLPTKLEALKIFSYFKESDWQVYRVGDFWVSLLIENLGVKKLLSLLKKLHPELTKKQFADIFYSVYKVKFSRQGLSPLVKEYLPR